jgi:endonuclease-3
MSNITRVCELLEIAYGRPEWPGGRPVLDELILTILSQNTTAQNCNEAFRRLSERFPTWDEARVGDVDQIADAIRVGGLANRKAPRIKRILEQVHERQGNLDLDWIADVPDCEAVEYMLEFDGVGRKTAACVLMFGLGRPVMPVDTHVHRVATRLGLIGKMTADAAHDVLQEMVPPENIYSCHVNLVTHGRRICHARGPECGPCVVNMECDYFAGQSRTHK